MHEFYRNAVNLGYSAFKVKVGHRDLAWDVARLQDAISVVAAKATLMVDANEAWSPKQAIHALHAYRDAGINIYWVDNAATCSPNCTLPMISVLVSLATRPRIGYPLLILIVSDCCLFYGVPITVN